MNMSVAKFFEALTLLIVVFVNFYPTSSYPDEKCCARFPKAMDINTFVSRVATGEDWAELFYYICPFDAVFADFEQFRTRINVTNGMLTRTINVRPIGGSCIGPTMNTFTQVGSNKAIFQQTGADGLIREDHYLDTGCLDDYYIVFSCRDRAGAKRGRCFNYFFALMIRNDPPANFPWDKAVNDLKRFGIKARDLINPYVGEVCPLIVL